jgi:ribosomal protein S18 acetylase RimI-like enzyme
MNRAAAHAAIRRATPEDASALFDICLMTADSGQDARALYGDPRLPGFVWAAAYGALEPDFAFLLAAADGALGYVLGTPDTEAFADSLEVEWWPEVRRKVAGLAASRPLDARALAYIASPERHPAWLQADYPAHLHINLLPEAQSSGWGRRLINAELAALRAHGVRGVHLGVSPGNARAIGFYRHLGFEDISRDGKVLFGIRFR